MNTQLQTTSTADDEAFISGLMTPFAPEPETMTVFDILGVSKPMLLMTLFNSAKPIKDDYWGNRYVMTIEAATDIIEGFTSCGTYNPPMTDFTHGSGQSCAYGPVRENGSFMGRVLAFDLTGDELDTSGYDAANGENRGRHVYYTVLAAIEGGYTPAAISDGR